MVKNVGDMDAYLRITGGLMLLGIGIMHSSKTLSLIGSMKVAEGVTRFCPMLYMLKMDTHNLEQKVRTDIEEQ